MLSWLIVLVALAILLLVFLTRRLGLHPLPALLGCTIFYGLAAGMPLPWLLWTIGDGMTASFGSTGLFLLVGSLLALFLDWSGAGEWLGDAFQHRWRTKNVAAIAALVGWLGGGIAAPGEAVFLLFAPLARSVAQAVGRAAAGPQLSLGFAVLGSSALILPAPAPVIVATILEADLVRVLVCGVVAAAVAATTGYVFVAIAERLRWLPADPVAIPPSAESADSLLLPPCNLPEAQGRAGIVASLLPISVSLVLLILAAVGQLPIEPLGHGSGELLRALGSPLMVLLAAMVLTLMPGRRRWRTVLGESSWLSTAIMGAAPLILITAAATGFSRVLQNSGLPDLAGEALGGMGMEAGLVLPFVIAAALRIAQGSVLVAMISAGGFCEPLLANLGLSDGSGRAFATLAIGAGAMVGSHANDSLFWVVSRTIGLSPAAGYRLQTLGTCCAGFAAALALVGLRAIVG